MSNLRDNLVLHLKLDSLPILDQNGQNLGCIPHGTPEIIDDRILGRCLRLKDDSYIDIPYERIPKSDSFTISLWVLLSEKRGDIDQNSEQIAVSMIDGGHTTPTVALPPSAGYHIDLRANGTLCVGIATGTVSFHPSLIINSEKRDFTFWTHIALTSNNNDGLALYVHGIKGRKSSILRQSSVIQFKPFQPEQKVLLRIGATRKTINSDIASSFLDGCIANLRIYNKALSESEVVHDMAQSISLFEEHLRSLEEQVKSQQESYIRLDSNYKKAFDQISALNTGATKADLTAQLDQARSLIADNGLKLKVSETQNILSSAHLKVSNLRDSVEEAEKDQTWDNLIKQAQQSAEQSASLSPDSAVAKKAKELAELVPKKSKEAKDQANNAIDAANKTDQLLKNLAKHVDEFDNLSLSSLSDPERTTKLAEVDSIRNYAEQILSAFAEAPAYSKVDDILEQQITNSNISSAVENTKKQILNIKFAANAVEQAKREAEEAVRMAKQQAEEAGKLYARNRNALDKIFGLTTDPEESSKTPANSKISIPSTSEPVQETLFKKSVKQLFGFKAEEGNSESGLERQPEEPDRSINEKENMSASQSS